MKTTAINPNLSRFLIYASLIGALATYMLPMVRADIPPFVNESWSAWQMTRSLPKLFTHRESGADLVRVDFDFIDTLVKILPKNRQGERRKFSIPFLLGILVPVALAGAYLFAMLSLLLVILKRENLFLLTSLGNVLCSVYAVAGTFYLGRQAARVFQKAYDRAAEGFLGGIAKGFVREITFDPAVGLYALLGLSVFVFMLGLLREPQRRKR